MSGGRQSWLMVDSYEDSGCPDLGIPSCLSCPLPACRLDLSPKQAGRWCGRCGWWRCSTRV